MDMPDRSLLIVACDSLGGIGPKPQDTVQVPGYIVGRFSARVPLMEVMASGARPQVLVNTLCVEMFPAGQEIITGIEDEIRSGNLDIPVVTGSTEENVETCQTGVGITVMGLLTPDRNLRLGSAAKGDLVICVGRPKVGCEVRLEDKEIVNLPVLQSILELDYVDEILPVGSKGIAYEAKLLAQTAGLDLELSKVNTLGPPLDPAKSAGPATCLLCSLPPDCLPQFRRDIDRPVAVIGRLS